jgi:SAM-dependent methyltransferase
MTSAKSQGCGLESKMNPDNGRAAEALQPLPNVAPDSFKNRILFGIRLLLDLEVSTTYRDVKKFLKGTRNNILEVGCGLKPYRHLVPPGVCYRAIDWERSQTCFHYKSNDVLYYSGDIFPLQDNSFDFIFHTEVLEHVYNLHRFLFECRRVLSKNGSMFFTIPFAARNHYVPNDYWRLTPSSIEKLCKEAGFKRVLVKPRGSDVTVATSKLNAVLFRVILVRFKNPVLRVINRLFFGLLFVGPIIFLTVIGQLSILLSIGSPDDPLGYTVYCNK